MTIKGTRGAARLIRMGEFSWTDSDGKAQTATFCVRTGGEIDRRFSDYNAQYTSAFDQLSQTGTKIQYKEFTPCALY
jgi:hypothetical protein